MAKRIRKRRASKKAKIADLLGTLLAVAAAVVAIGLEQPVISSVFSAVAAVAIMRLLGHSKGSKRS